jgi:hypothetical protein
MQIDQPRENHRARGLNPANTFRIGLFAKLAVIAGGCDEAVFYEKRAIASGAEFSVIGRVEEDAANTEALSFKGHSIHSRAVGKKPQTRFGKNRLKKGSGGACPKKFRGNFISRANPNHPLNS